MKLYLDSNVLIAYLLREFGKMTDFMEQAFEDFIVFCEQNNHEIVLSDIFFKEVQKISYTGKEEVVNVIKRISSFIKIVDILSSSEEKSLANKIEQETGLHFADSLHTATALKFHCDYIITWNKKDFNRAYRYVRNLNPKEAIQVLSLS